MSLFISRRSPTSSGSGEMLQTMLKDDKAWLDDVEAQVDIDERTKNLKEELRDWTYDAEDVLDEWEFEQLRAKVEAPLAPIFGGRSDRSPVAHLSMDRNFRERVNDLMQRRDEIWAAHRQLRLVGARRPGGNVKPLPSSSLLTELEIHGREEDKEILVRFLQREDIEEKLSVVPVLGAAGVGKTTLLQHIYNDPEVSQHFKFKEWVSASGGRQMMDVLKAIAEYLTRVPCNFNQLEAVQNLLKPKIHDQKFLLVLDDVRYETVDRGQWEKLCAILGGCANGSVIILATQDERVADKTSPVLPFMLESLSGNLCWSVFKKHAFSGSPPTDTRLVGIGEKIAKECQGSPLVAKALGIKLRYERDVGKWEELLSQRDMWHEVVPELKLSYCGLSAHLKRCFVYCSMFPKEYLFNREELVRLWRAQGFIKEERGKSLEDVGLNYFDELYTMSLFQKSELDTGAFVVPNVLHSLAQAISDGECVTSESCNLLKLPMNDLHKARHLSLMPTNSKLSTNFLCIATKLRSFLVVPTWPVKNIAHISLSEKAFHCLNHLRVLDLRHTYIKALPDTIRELKHLRYLNLSGTKIEYVDASVFQLYNLQTLDLSCTDIKELPDTIGNLSKLLYLHLNVTKITKLPESVGKLSELQTLHLGLTKIEELPETIGRLECLRFLCLDVSRVQVLPESICGISNMQRLELQGAGDEDLVKKLNEQNDQIVHRQDVRDMDDSSTKCHFIDARESSSTGSTRQEHACENLQKHANLEEINTRFHYVKKLFMWTGEPSVSKLVRVEVKNDMKCTTLPQLGQLPLLKELYIDGMSVEHVGKEFCGSGGKNGFPRLENLSFLNMSEWKKWDRAGESDFPNLKELIIFNCPKLKGVPCLRSSLIKLKVERCAVESIPIADSLEDLELLACDNLVTLPSFSSILNLTLMYCQNLTSLPTVQSVESFWIEECKQLTTSLSEELKNFALSSITFTK